MGCSSDLECCFTPLFYTCIILGLWSPMPSDRKPFRAICRVLTLLIAVCQFVRIQDYLVHIIVRNMQRIRAHRIFELLGTGLLAMTLLWCLGSHLLRRSDFMTSIISQLTLVDKQLMSESQRKILYTKARRIVILLLLGVAFVYTFAYAEYLYRTDLLRLVDVYLDMVLLGESLQFMVLVLTMKHRFSVINQRLTTLPQTEAELLCLQKAHLTLTRVTTAVNDTYGGANILHVSHILFSLVSMVYYFRRFISATKSERRGGELCMVVSVLVMLVAKLVSLAACCHLAAGKASKTASVLRDFLIEERRTSMMNRLRRFELQVEITKPKFEIWGLVAINGELVAKVATSALTFVIILLQFMLSENEE